LTRQEKFCSLIISHIVFVAHSTYSGSLILVNVTDDDAVSGHHTP